MISKLNRSRARANGLALIAMMSAVLAGPAAAAGRVPVPALSHPRSVRGARIDPRVVEFNRDVAAYQRTVAALRRDTQRLQALQHRLDALGKELNSGAQMDMIHLQSLMSSRQTAVQLSTNLIKSLGETADAVAGNTGK